MFRSTLTTRRSLLHSATWVAGSMLLAASTAHADFDTTGVYDENIVQANVVDTSATVDNAEQVSLATFTNWVAAAFSLNQGGVIDFDSGSFTDINTIDANYGVNGKKTLRITNPTIRGWELIDPLGLQTSISGTAGMKKINGTTSFNGNDFLYDFDADAGVTAVGITMPSNLGFPSGVGNVSGRVRYSDNTSSASVSSNVASPMGADDTFWGFRSPEGKFITRLELLVSNDLFFAIDDLAFIFGPEIVPGDGNGDGHVDGTDYLLWAGNYGDNPADDPPGSPANGDFNGDGMVGALDYLLWAGNYGMGPLDKDSDAIPEPNTLGSLLLLVTILGGFGRRNR